MSVTLSTLNRIANSSILYEEGDSPRSPEYIIVDFGYPPVNTRMIVWIDISLNHKWEPLAGGYIQSIDDMETIIELIIQRYKEGWGHEIEANLSAFVEGQL